MQKMAAEARAKGAKVAVLLSHNGMDVDLKLASPVRRIDAIPGGHRHGGMPAALFVSNPGGKTLVTNSSSNGKFLKKDAGAAEPFTRSLTKLISINWRRALAKPDQGRSVWRTMTTNDILPSSLGFVPCANALCTVQSLEQHRIFDADMNFPTRVNFRRSSARLTSDSTDGAKIVIFKMN